MWNVYTSEVHSSHFKGLWVSCYYSQKNLNPFMFPRPNISLQSPFPYSPDRPSAESTIFNHNYSVESHWSNLEVISFWTNWPITSLKTDPQLLEPVLGSSGHSNGLCHDNMAADGGASNECNRPTGVHQVVSCRPSTGCKWRQNRPTALVLINMKYIKLHDCWCNVRPEIRFSQTTSMYHL